MFLFGFLRKNNEHFSSVTSTRDCFPPLGRPEVKLLKSFVRILALNVFKCVFFFCSFPATRLFSQRAHKFQRVWRAVGPRAASCWAGPAPAEPFNKMSYLRRRVCVCVLACFCGFLCVTSPSFSVNSSQMCRTGTRSGGTRDWNAAGANVSSYAPQLLIRL